jgi:hypothetical protein
MEAKVLIEERRYLEEKARVVANFLMEGVGT